MLTELLDESVLCRSPGHPDVLAEQLWYLHATGSTRPNVSIRVLPFGAGVLRVHIRSFALMEFPESLGPAVVFFEGGGDQFLDRVSDIAAYRDLFGDALHAALDPVESLRMIARYAADSTPHQPDP